MKFGKKRSPFRFLLHMAVVGAFFCAHCCILFGCGSSQEGVSENRKKSFDASSIPSKPQNAGQSGLKSADAVFPDRAKGKEISSESMGKPTEAAAGKDFSTQTETIPVFPGKPALTPQELEAVKRSAAMGAEELDAMEVVPPDRPGGRGITHGELKARVEALAPGLADLDNLEVAPPREPGGRGMTLGEIKALSGLGGPNTPPPNLPHGNASQ